VGGAALAHGYVLSALGAGEVGTLSVKPCCMSTTLQNRRAEHVKPRKVICTTKDTKAKSGPLKRTLLTVHGGAAMG